MTNMSRCQASSLQHISHKRDPGLKQFPANNHIIILHMQHAEIMYNFVSIFFFLHFHSSMPLSIDVSWAEGLQARCNGVFYVQMHLVGIS